MSFVCEPLNSLLGTVCLGGREAVPDSVSPPLQSQVVRLLSSLLWLLL